MKKYNIAIIGATGLVGKTIISLLEKTKMPIGEIFFLASSRSAGTTINYQDRVVSVQDLESFNPVNIDIAFFSAGGSVSEKYVPRFANSGAIVIDNTSFFRYEDDIPLIVPEINSNDLVLYKNRNIIANPNCSTIQMLLAIAPIHKRYNIKNIQVATYQAVSGAGYSAVQTLLDESKSFITEGKHLKSQNSKLPDVIGFNVLPKIDIMMEDGFTKEEWKMSVETKKILAKDIDVMATCVRVPVIGAHSEAIFLETKDDILDLEEVLSLYKDVSGVVIKKEGFDSPIYCEGKDDVFVSRVRKISNNRLALWCVGDNIRKGASLNAVQIFENLVGKGFI